MNKYTDNKDFEKDIINEFSKADMEDKVRKFLMDIKNVFLSDNAFLASEFEDYALSSSTKIENADNKDIKEIFSNKFVFDIDEIDNYKQFFESNRKEILYNQFLIKYLDNKIKLEKSKLNLSAVIKLSNEIRNVKNNVSKIENSELSCKNKILIKDREFKDEYKNLINKIKIGEKINNLKSTFSDKVINYFRHQKANFLLNFYKGNYPKEVLANELIIDSELSKLLQSEDIAEE